MDTRKHLLLSASVSVHYPAWLGRAEAAADERNETAFLYYSIRAGGREALDTRERPLRWPRPG